MAAEKSEKPAQAKEKKRFHIWRPAEEYLDEPIEDEALRHKPNLTIKVVPSILYGLIRLLFRVEVRGKENIPADEPVVMVSNHVSYVDPVIIYTTARPRCVRFMARSNLWRFPVVRPVISRVGALPIDPESADRKALKRAAASLKRGECVGIFAEGTRMRKHDKVYKPHGGFVLMAQMGKARIMPVGITGCDRIKPEGQKLFHFPKVVVTYGEPFSLSDFEDIPKKERAKYVADETMRRVFALRDSADPNPIRPGMPPYGIVPEEYQL